MQTPRAGSVYAASIEEPVGKRAGVRGAVQAVVAAAAGLVGDATGLAVGDLVVRRLDDGSEALRMDAGPGEEAAILLDSVRTQLDELDVAAFEETWTITRPEPDPR